VRVVVHRDALAAMMGPEGEIGRAARRAAGRIRDRAKENAPVRDGLLRNSIVSELEYQGLYNVVWRIGTDVEYAIYQELGTGPIFARRAPYLVFKVGDRWVSTYSTRGVPAVRYLTRAIEETSIADFRPGG
jgi:HK97 gp10 family phage protein